MPTNDENNQLAFDFEQTPQQLLTVAELFERVDGRSLRVWSEDSRIEKKSAGIHARQLGEYMSMWANTAPDGGLIVIGVRDDRRVEGCLQVGVERVNQLEKTAETYCPDATCYAKRLNVKRDTDQEQDFVLVFHVLYHRHRVVRTSDGKVFVRRGDSKFELRTPEQIRQLQADKGEISLEKEPCGLSYPGDFQMDMIAEFAAAVRAKKTWNAGHSTEEILELMQLGELARGKFVPNMACALLFSSNPRSVMPGCRIRFLRFEGEYESSGHKWNAVKDELVDGPIPQQIQRAAVVISSQLRTFSRLGTGGRFFTSPEYPEAAWYEAVVNSCVHR